jgi:hypothetical protein
MARQAADIESRVSVLSSKPHYETRKARWDWFVISETLSWKNLKLLPCRWYAAFRSFRGHIRILSSRMGGWVHAGPAYTVLDQCCAPNEGTLARVRGIETLRSIYRWADAVDCRVFLMGFDAGEKYNMAVVGHLSTPAKQQVHVENSSCDQLSQIPNTGTDASSHCGGHAQG